jgi:hypothetical protein
VHLQGKYLKLRLFSALLCGLLASAGSASAALVTQTQNIGPDGTVRWNAVFRVGGSAAPEMLLGDRSRVSFPEQSTDFPWTSGMAEPFSVAYDGLNTLTMTLGSGGSEQTLDLMLDSVVPPIGADVTELLIEVYASSQTTTGAGAPVDMAEVVLSQLFLDGEAVSSPSASVFDPCAGTPASPAPGTDCDFINQFLRIAGTDLSDGFLLTGMGTLSWLGGDEPPALDRLRWEVMGFRPTVPMPEPSAALLLGAGLAAAALARGRRA